MTASHTEPRNEFDFTPDYHARPAQRQPQPAVELTGADVWTGVKQGFGMAFFIGIALGILRAVSGSEGGMAGEMNYYRLVIGCTLLGPFVWVPLALGCRAHSRSQSAVAQLLRLLAGLFITGYVCSVLFVMGMIVYVKLNKPSQSSTYSNYSTPLPRAKIGSN